MAEGGFNLVWCGTESEMDIAGQHGLRVLFRDDELFRQPRTLDDPAQLAKLDALIARVKNHPSLYAYFITDEPSADQFPALGRMVAHLRAQDPAHLAYINLLPTYADRADILAQNAGIVPSFPRLDFSKADWDRTVAINKEDFRCAQAVARAFIRNDQLGVKGEAGAPYKECLRQFIETVKPELLSYDHYHFQVGGDGDQYFLNLGIIRQAALDAGIPFLNIVQASTWDKSMRVPNGDEMRWLNYTSLAYGAQALSYYVYFEPCAYEIFKEKTGGMMRPDGSTTPQYEAAKALNPQFVAIASQLQPLRSLGAYHTGKIYLGAQALPVNAPFHIALAEGDSPMPASGMLLGYFGKPDNSGKPCEPTYVLVVNLDYRNAITKTVVGPGQLEAFDAVQQTWKRASGPEITLALPPGGGTLVRTGE
jgi:NAD(P)-dependent dehydrogenase (short-subunit alcohol dehydrogenase family)